MIARSLRAHKAGCLRFQ